MIKLYGIKNCDTIKKARQWLDQSDVDYQFHDYRIDGITEQELKQWCQELGWEQLLNRRGLTWRKLPEEVKSNVSEIKAIELMLSNPAIIKRPLLDTGQQKILGFSSDNYQQIFK